MTATVEVYDPPFAAQEEAVQLLLALEQAGAVTPTSLQLTDPEMSYERYDALGVFLGRMKRWTSWAIGDWLNFGEGVYGERFAQAAANTHLSEQTLLHYQFVAREIPEARREVSVAFGAHALVARMEPREQSRWLKQAAKKGWGERELRDAIKAKRTEMHPTLLPEEGEPGEMTPLAEVGLAILRDAVPHDDGQHYLIPNEDMVRLRAALGQEE